MNLVSGLPIPTQPEFFLVNSWIEKDSLKKPRETTAIIHDLPDEIAFKWKQRRVYLQGEPEAIIRSRDFLLKNAHRFHSILTYDSEVLQRCPNAHKYVFGGCWVHPVDREKINPHDKQFAVSTLVGTKIWGEGHAFRGLIYSRQKEIESIPYTFYRSTKTGTIPEITRNPLFVWDSKFELFRTFQFSIAVENSKQMNYFTEKLVDCFITKTIPIYWGCPNIGEYFRTDGMIILNSSTFEELKAKLDELTPETYESKCDAIEVNYQRALQYTSVSANINRGLQSIADY